MYTKSGRKSFGLSQKLDCVSISETIETGIFFKDSIFLESFISGFIEIGILFL